MSYPNNNEDVNNVVYCLEKYQVTILATENVTNLYLIQHLEELGWNSKGVIVLIESNNYPFVSTAERYCFGKHGAGEGSNVMVSSHRYFLRTTNCIPQLLDYNRGSVFKRAISRSFTDKI